jgi:lipoprotein signal peptidase
VFNIADAAITIGAILLAYTILKKPEARETRNQSRRNLKKSFL